MELYRITSMIELVQLATGIHWRPESIRLVMPRAETVDACPILSKSKIRFSQPISAIAIQGNLLRLPVHLSIPGRIKTGSNKADLNSDFASSIRQIINSYALTKNISIEEVANITDMTVRSLQRRLNHSGLKFNDWLNQAK